MDENTSCTIILVLPQIFYFVFTKVSINMYNILINMFSNVVDGSHSKYCKFREWRGMKKLPISNNS